MSEQDYTFIVRPWKDKYRSFYKSRLKTIWTELKGFPPLKAFDDFDDVGSDTLYDAIRAKIFGAAFVVVDISLGLPNVYWEYGYALALSKPVLLLRKDEHTYKRNLKRIVEAAKVYRSQDLDSIIDRFFSIPSDVGGVIYQTYDDKKFKSTDAVLLEDLLKKTNAALKQAYDRPQLSELREFQFRKYLEFDAQNRNTPVVLYFYYCDHESSPKTWDWLNKCLDSAKLKPDHIVFHFEKEPIHDEVFHKFVTQHPDAAITPLRYNWKFILIQDSSAYFSDGLRYFLSKGGSFRDSIAKLRLLLLDSRVSLECSQMLKHMIRIQNQLGFEDVQLLEKDGFSFDSSSKLWITGPDELLDYVSSKEDARNLCNQLQNHISDHFQRFAAEYLNQAKYVAAFWPLNPESMDLALRAGSAIREWIDVLNKWALNALSNGEQRPTDRFFVIPRNEGLLDINGYRLRRKNYKTKIIKFFKDGFRIQKCSYRERVFVIFDLDPVMKSIFGRDSQILRQNAILFSREAYTEEKFRGVLQFEEPIELKKAERKVLNFRYWKIPENYGHLRSERLTDLLREMKAIKKALDDGRKVHLRECQAIIGIKDFLRDVCKEPLD